MAHTVEDKILELADKYTTDGTDGNYRRNKEMLLEFAKALGIDTGDATYHIESLVRKSPASEDLEQAAIDYDSCRPALYGEDDEGDYVEYIEVRKDSFIAGAQWDREQTRDRLLFMLNTSIDNAHFFEQLDNYIDELDNNKE